LNKVGTEAKNPRSMANGQGSVWHKSRAQHFYLCV